MRALTSCAALMLASTLSGCASTGSAPYSPTEDPVAQQLALHSPQALPAYLAARQQSEAEGDDFEIPWRKVLNVSVAVVAYHNPMMGLTPGASAFMAMTSAPALLPEDDGAKEPAMASMDVTALLMAQGQQHLQSRIEELEQQLAASLTPLSEQPQALASALTNELAAHDLPGGDALSRQLAENVSSLSEQWLTTEQLSFGDTLTPKMSLLDQYLTAPSNDDVDKSSLLADEIVLSVGSLWRHPRQQRLRP